GPLRRDRPRRGDGGAGGVVGGGETGGGGEQDHQLGAVKPPQHGRDGAMKAGIIVVGVFVLLCAISLFVICAPMFLDDAEVSRAKMDVKTLEKALLQHHSAHGAWPKNLAVLAAPQEDGSPA